MDERLILFAKYPRAGEVKTRLATELGSERAAALHESMTRSTIAWAMNVAKRRPVAVDLFGASAAVDDFQDRFGSGPTYRPQSTGGLGERLFDAFSRSRSQGAKRTVVVGTDCPGLDDATAAYALDALGRCQLVLGPAWDGGYYLIGLREPTPELFQDIEWGSETVFDQTVRVAEKLGMSICILDPLPDVDRIADLPHWTIASRSPVYPLGPANITIVIPVRNEESVMESTLKPLLAYPEVEVIVVDGGSTDQTAEIVRACGVRLLCCADGRAAQLNLGASAANGEHLVFLHADTKLPDDFPRMVTDALRPADVSAGAFWFRLDHRSWRLKLVEVGVNLRTRLFRMPYGDQAIFSKATTFWAAGGFPWLPILEDEEFIRTMRKFGRINIATGNATTSARRWRKYGVVRTWWINQKVLIGRRLGVPHHQLAEWYRRS